MANHGNNRVRITTLNGRYKIHVDGLPMLCFNQLDFLGYYAFKDDHLLYGIDLYLKGHSKVGTRIEVHCKTKEMWLLLLQILDTI
jgi:hypothetical protein